MVTIIGVIKFVMHYATAHRNTRFAQRVRAVHAADVRSRKPAGGMLSSADADGDRTI